jgi:uncharacterized membrane protein
MNKFLLAVFDNEPAADAGLQALQALHRTGDITLYGTGVLARDAEGLLHVRKGLDTGSDDGKATGLAVGALIGLLGGPAGFALGALTGTAAGALRDFWVAGVGIDFVEQAQRSLQAGQVALLAEIEEEWIVPVDVALEAAGGRVMRRGRQELAEAQSEHEIEALKQEIAELESEASAAGGAALARVKAQLLAVRSGQDRALQRARDRVDAIGVEGHAKAQALKAQWAQAQGDMKARIDGRIERVRIAQQLRGAKLSRAWGLAKEALAT